MTDQRHAQCRVEANSVVFVWAETPRLPSDHPYGGEVYATRLNLAGVTVDVEPELQSSGVGIRSHAFLDHGQRVRVELSLASSEPARVQVIDIQGRRVGDALIGASARSHVSAEIPIHSGAGILFVRLEQGPRHATRKIIRLR